MRCSELLSLGALVAALVAFEAYAIPLARYERASAKVCDRDELCSLSVHAEGTLGSYTGVSVGRRQAVSGRIAATHTKSGGRMQVESAGAGLVSVLFSWDGDSNPQQLSGAGLGCVDLRAHRGVALVIRDFSVAADCEDAVVYGGQPSGCSAAIIETRLYDAADPTGEIYSWSSIRRPLKVAEASSLVIPFSNFLYHSPRGAARFTCAGALTLSVKVSGSKKLQLEMGGVYIDDQYGLYAAPTATPTKTPTQTPVALVEVSPTVSAAAAPSIGTQIVEPEMATTVATAEPAGDNFQKEGAHRVGVGTFAIDKAENEAIYGAVVSP